MLQQQEKDLSPSEVVRLIELEREVKEHLGSFLICGRALLEIKERKLYKRYGTFEVYCRDRWDMGAHQANELVRAVQTTEHLLAGPAGVGGDAPLPKDLAPSTIRPLTKFEPELQTACWRVAARISERPSEHTVRTIVTAVEHAILQANGHTAAPGQEPRKPKEVFLPSLYKLAQGESFSAQIIVMRVDETQAQKLALSCQILAQRCEAIQRELQRQFPHVSFGHLSSDQSAPVAENSVASDQRIKGEP